MSHIRLCEIEKSAISIKLCDLRLFIHLQNEYNSSEINAATSHRCQAGQNNSGMKQKNRSVSNANQYHGLQK